jgi:hypothetical protein
MEVRIFLLLLILLFPHAPATTGLAQTTRPSSQFTAKNDNRKNTYCGLRKMAPSSSQHLV